MSVGLEVLLAIALGSGPAPETPSTATPSAPPPVSADAPPPVQAQPPAAAPGAAAPAAPAAVSPDAAAAPSTGAPQPAAPAVAAPVEPAPTPPPPVAMAPTPQLPDLAATRDAHLEEYQTRYGRRRTALLATSGAMLAVSLGLYLGTALSVRALRHRCEDDSDDLDTRCVRLVDGSAVMLAGGMLFSAGAVVTSGLGGSMAGKAEAATDLLAREPAKPKRVAKGLGIGLLAAGGVALIATNLSLAGGSLNRCNDDSGCLARGINFHIAGLAGATVLATVGAGLTGYAVSYERAHRGWTRPGFAFSRDGATLTLSGQF